VLFLLDRLRKLAPDIRAVPLIILERGEDYETDVGLACHDRWVFVPPAMRVVYTTSTGAATTRPNA